jgi:nephrocystin-3
VADKLETAPLRKREIRVFISSTFRDLQEEREELVKHVFPKLRKLCEERGVAWREVDLRWGVTEERAERGDVLRVCFAEIDQCRPYFIGLLAERYGFVPEAIPDELTKKQPWLAENRAKSLTELEIIHGVLTNPAMADRALFYFRDPAYAEKVPPEKRADFVEEDPEARRKVARLKDRIRQGGLPIRENYADPSVLGELVLRDFTAIIDEQYPADKVPDPLGREALEHEMFGESRRDVYIGRKEYFDRLDEHGSGAADGPGLVVLGESGSGKSALLANWASRYRSQYPDDLVIMHFIGATPYSTDWAAMLRRIMDELKRKFDITQEIPDKPDELRSAFANWLHMAAAKGRVVLILDALNQLEDRDGAPDLVWLPPVIPGNVRLVASTLPGHPLEELTKRQWPTLQLKPLEDDERRELIKEYLKKLYAKELSEERVKRIAAAPQSANPLYLQALLEELRLFGVHERLDERISYYLGAKTVSALYERILERYEEDYERDRPGLVRDAMTYLWAARRGLAEAEVLDLLGCDGQPLPQAFWSPFYLAAERSLVSRSGLIGFFHDYLRQAVQNRYLDTPQKCKDAHIRLADYFETRDLGARKIDEFPWQLAEAAEWQRLYGLLSDLRFLEAAWLVDQFEVKTYWARVEAESALRMDEAYRPVIDNPADNREFVWIVAALLADMGYPVEALKLRQYLIGYYREIDDRGNLQVSLGDQASILFTRGDLDGAMKLLKEKESICRELGNRDGLESSLGNQALILRVRGDLDGAMKLMKDQELICRELRDKDGLSSSLGNQANILYTRGDLDGAMKLMRDQELMCRELGDKDGLERSLGNQAVILKDHGDLDGAVKLHKEEELICRELGDKDGLQRSLGNQAVILQDRGDLGGAVKLLEEQEFICRELGNMNGLQASLGNRASILYVCGDLDGAQKLLKETERLCLELGNRDGLSISLGSQALILKARGDLDGAMSLHKEEERICRELGNKNGIQRSLGNQATILYACGDLDGTMKLAKEEERICRELGDKYGLLTAIGNEAVILQDRGDLDGAMKLHKEAEGICRELGSKDGLSISLGGQALILEARGDLDGAMKLHKEEELICRGLGNKDGLQRSLGSQALILKARGDVDGAMKLYKESEGICRELENRDGLQRSLGNQALILKARGDLDGAMKLLREHECICRELGNKDDLQRSLGNQANILHTRGDLGGAIKLHQEEERICRELGKVEGLAISLANQSMILARDKKSPEEALSLAGEAYLLAKDHGLGQLARQIEPLLESLRGKAKG